MADLPSILRVLGLLAVVPPVADAVVRLFLAGAASRRSGGAVRPRSVSRWLVVVPARGEGAAVADTLRSIVEAAAGQTVETVLLLDGPDPEAARVGKEYGVRVVVKAPAGPAKGAALAWLASRHGELLDGTDGALILDVGSRLGPRFFESVEWLDGADAVQAWLRGVGRGVGDAVILSESLAQEIEDRGRQALGWNVHLRGTGTAFTPAAFRRMVSRLRTAVEDTEATLLLSSEGGSTAMMGPGAVVEDVKPSRVNVAARQRSRWLLGELTLLVRQPRALARFLVRRPVEALSFLASLLSRPLSLSGALRVVLVVACAADAMANGTLISWVAAAVIASTLASDLVLLRWVTGMPWTRLGGAGLRLLTAWIGAVFLLPRAALGWVRGRR